MSFSYTQDRCDTINARYSSKYGVLVLFVHTAIHVSAVLLAIYTIYPNTRTIIYAKFVYLNVPLAYATVSLVINGILTFTTHLFNRRDRNPTALFYIMYTGIDKLSVFDEFSILRELGTSVLYHTLIHTLVVVLAFVLSEPQRVSDVAKEFWQINLAWNAIMMVLVGVIRLVIGDVLYGPGVLVNTKPVVEFNCTNSRIEHDDSTPQDTYDEQEIDNYTPPSHLITYTV
jgi:hypothetical protein